jgi:uncharacterized protein
MNSNGQENDWRRRTILGTRMGDDPLPTWLPDTYAAFHANVADRKYPCFFGSEAERKGKLYYSYVHDGRISHLPSTLQTFLGLCTNIGRDKNNLVVFFEPATVPATHSQDRAKFWNILQYLHDHDPGTSAPAYRLDPSDPLWEFPFAERQFFVVGISPSYRMHRSRNLGPCMMMVFQPREVFQGSRSGNEINAGTRLAIRKRATLWDGIPAHPDLNVYGQPGNQEWSQYFISDDNSRETGRCPLSRSRGSDGPQSVEPSLGCDREKE